jgi:hypothetical protein
LTTGRAVDVGGIAEQEGPALAEMLRHPVMNMVGRKPIHLLDVNFEIRDRPVADVFERERIRMISALIAHGSDQARSTLPRQGKNRQEISFVG